MFFRLNRKLNGMINTRGINRDSLGWNWKLSSWWRSPCENPNALWTAATAASQSHPAHVLG
jgi:hypothetical protein